MVRNENALSKEKKVVRFLSREHLYFVFNEEKKTGKNQVPLSSDSISYLKYEKEQRVQICLQKRQVVSENSQKDFPRTAQMIRRKTKTRRS